jgi:hypothetical protein
MDGLVSTREAIMAAKEISVKKYVVRLSGEERVGDESKSLNPFKLIEAGD